MKGAVEGWGDELAEFLPALAERPAGERAEHPHALAANALDDAVGFKAGVRLADGHRIDFGGQCDLANAGQQIALAKLAAGNEGVHLIDELPIDWHPGAGVDFEKIGVGRHVY